MLSARRKSDGQTITAYLESKKNGPFVCLQCNEEVILKTGRLRVNHFAHTNPIACKFAEGESDTHRRCKLEIYMALRKMSQVTNLALELPLGPVRPDIYVKISGVPVAIEVQFSSLSVETIMREPSTTPGTRTVRGTSETWSDATGQFAGLTGTESTSGAIRDNTEEDPNAWNRSEADSTGTSHMEMRGGGYSESEVPFLRPIMGQELSSVQFRPLEE